MNDRLRHYYVAAEEGRSLTCIATFCSNFFAYFCPGSGILIRLGKVRLFTQFQYKAKTWDKKRRVIAKAEHSERGANPRYVVTNLDGASQALYDELYCARGEMENRIKEQQLGLFSDRTSCHAWWANQFRLLLSSAAYVLLETLRRIGLSATKLARAQVTAIRLRLLKIGAVITRNTRRIRLWLSSSFPLQELLCSCLVRFSG